MLLLGSPASVVVCFPFSFRRPIQVLSRAKQYDLVNNTTWHAGRPRFILYSSNNLKPELPAKCCRNGIASVKVKFCVVLESIFVKNWIASKKMQSPAGYETMSLKSRENVWSCARCASPADQLPLHPALEGIKVSDEGGTSVRQSWLRCFVLFLSHKIRQCLSNLEPRRYVLRRFQFVIQAPNSPSDWQGCYISHK